MIHDENHHELADRTCPRRPSAEPGSPVPGQAVPPSSPAGGTAPKTPALGTQITGNASPGAGSTYVIELPAGMKLLSLNGREHHMARYRTGKAIKDAAVVMARKARIPRLNRAHITVEYQPPDRRHRDAENVCAASGKAAIDGIVLAGVLVDDECPRYVTGLRYVIGPVYPRGRLVLHITAVAAAAP